MSAATSPPSHAGAVLAGGRTLQPPRAAVSTHCSLPSAPAVAARRQPQSTRPARGARDDGNDPGRAGGREQQQQWQYVQLFEPVGDVRVVPAAARQLLGAIADTAASTQLCAGACVKPCEPPTTARARTGHAVGSSVAARRAQAAPRRRRHAVVARARRRCDGAGDWRIVRRGTRRGGASGRAGPPCYHHQSVARTRARRRRRHRRGRARRSSGGAAAGPRGRGQHRRCRPPAHGAHIRSRLASPLRGARAAGHVVRCAGDGGLRRVAPVLAGEQCGAVPRRRRRHGRRDRAQHGHTPGAPPPRGQRSQCLSGGARAALPRKILSLCRTSVRAPRRGISG